MNIEAKKCKFSKKKRRFRTLPGLWLLLMLAFGACRMPAPAPAKPVTEAGRELAAPGTPTPLPLRPTPTLAPAAPTLPPPTVPPELVTIGDPYIPDLGNGGYDVTRYILRLGLDPAETAVSAHVTIEAVSTMPLETLALDFVGYDIVDVQINGVPALHARQDDKLLITPPGPLPGGASLQIDVTYSGSPSRRPSPYVGFVPSLGLQFADGEVIYALAEPDGARYWFPANDHPRDKAAFRFELTVPQGLTAVANGVLLPGAEAAGMPLPAAGPAQTFVWEHSYPMATYLATTVVGPFTRLEGRSAAGVPIRHYILPDTAEEFARVEAVTGEAIDWLSARLGPYPFEAIGFVTVPVPGISLETQTMILLSTGMIGLRTAVHELAHMWFGNWVSLDSWRAMWRNEGLATYMQLLWEYRDDPEGLALEMAALETAVIENGDQFPLGDPPPEKLFSFNVYIKGALFAHELRQQVGDEAFFAGLQLYFARHGGGTANDADFQAAMEEAAGQSLAPFFAEWLE